MKLSAIAAILLAATLLTGCATIAKPQSEPSAAVHQTITADMAYQLMAETEPYILLDVRTPEEFEEGHIEGALLIPDSELAEKAEVLLPDKDARILVYCRSGRRSAISAATLASMGYTNVYDFGGIIDWPYETVTGS